MTNDDIFQNSDIISLNETHSGHSDTLPPHMMGISKDMLIVHCDCNNRGGGVDLIVNTNVNPKQIRMNTILEIVVVEISEPIQMIVISVYRPPSTPIDVFMNHMSEIIAQFQHVPTCVIGTSMKMYQLHQIPAAVQCLDYKALSKWSINQHMIVEQ